MDEQVRDAMARWPDVPAVYGWLRLDRRGRWMLVDRGRPGFDERLHGEGSPITSPQIVAFIGRNYLADERGRWYWQNGPQRVFVDLETAPLVLRVFDSGPQARLAAHTGEPVTRVDDAWRSAAGDLILLTDLGPGAIHDLDLAALALDDAPPPGASIEDTLPEGSGESGLAQPSAWLTLYGRTFALRDLPAGRALPFDRRPRP